MRAGAAWRESHRAHDEQLMQLPDGSPQQSRSCMQVCGAPSLHSPQPAGLRGRAQMSSREHPSEHTWVGHQCPVAAWHVLLDRQCRTACQLGLPLEARVLHAAEGRRAGAAGRQGRQGTQDLAISRERQAGAAAARGRCSGAPAAAACAAQYSRPAHVPKDNKHSKMAGGGCSCLLLQLVSHLQIFAS